MHLRMAARAQRGHELELGLTRYAVVHDDALLPCAWRVADAAAVPVAFQYRFAQIAEVLFVLAPDHMIEDGRLKARRMGNRVLVPAEELLRFASTDLTYNNPAFDGQLGPGTELGTIKAQPFPMTKASLLGSPYRFQSR